MIPRNSPHRPLGGISRQRSNFPLRAVVLLSAIVLMVGATAVVQMATREAEQPVPVQAPPPPPQPQVEMVDCLVAINKIEPGTPLDPSKFRKETRPVVSGTANLVTSFDKLRGAYAASFIAAEQPLLTDYVTVKAPVNEIQANIPTGYRAVAVAVDDVSNVEGWVRAGAKVDVLLASEVSGKPAITLLVQNAKVLSTGKVNAANVSGNPRTGVTDGDSSSGVGTTTITIMVTIEEATKIQLASTTGVMSLSLRGDEDTVESPDNVTVTIDSVFGITAPQGTPGPRREGSLVVGGRSFVIQGGKLVPAESQNVPEKK